jgi:hypothetical protein
LMKFSTVEQIGGEADKAMIKFAQKAGGIKLVEGDEELYSDLDNGYSLVRLLTPGALDRESSVMQHCIGQGGYDNYLKSGERLFLSLRDAFGKAHATLEIKTSSGEIQQMQGKQNAAPVFKYVAALRPFFASGQFKAGHIMRRLNAVMDVEGTLISLDSIPDNSHIICDVNLDCTRARFPSNLTVKGNLSISGNSLTSLMPGIVVDGDLSVQGCPLEAIPDDLRVSGNFVGTGLKITSLPEGFTIGGDLRLEAPELASLPSGLKVGGSLNVSGSLVSELPADMSVGSTVNVSKTRLGTLPAGFVCNGDLHLSELSISSLPEGLKVVGVLDISHATFASAPESIEVGGDLRAENSDIVEIPGDWTIGGSILAQQSKVERLPGRPHVNGDLRLGSSGIKDLSELRSVSGSLDISRTAPTALPPSLEIGENLNAAYLDADLPSRLHIKGRMVAKHATFTRLPEDFFCGACLDLNSTKLSELPENLVCTSYIDISSTNITRLPDGFVTDDLYAKDTPLVSIGANVVIRVRVMTGDNDRIKGDRFLAGIRNAAAAGNQAQAA